MGLCPLSFVHCNVLLQSEVEFVCNFPANITKPGVLKVSIKTTCLLHIFYPLNLAGVVHLLQRPPLHGPLCADHNA